MNDVFGEAKDMIELNIEAKGNMIVYELVCLILINPRVIFNNCNSFVWNIFNLIKHVDATKYWHK